MLKQLHSFKRVSLLDGATPLQRLYRLEKAVEADRQDVEIWVKRDDFMSLGGGGNKLRKLEFLLGEALAQGCDTLIAIGGKQSNFARLAAAAAAKYGMACELVLASMVPIDTEHYNLNGNVLLDNLFDARLHFPPAGSDALAFANARAEELKQQGRKSYIGVLGGSTPVGCLGYTACAAEIFEQERAAGVEFTDILMANGSSGMQAGLIAGRVLLGQSASAIRGYTVLADKAAVEQTTLDKANAVLTLLGTEQTITANDIVISDAQRGAAYGLPTDAMKKAVRLMASQEGLLLDPVYSGKAFAGLLEDLESGKFKSGSRILFIMSGGAPGLYAYRDIFN